jgi:ketosteroid isomerase-like protein
MTSADVMRDVSAAWKGRDYRMLRDLLHPDGVWFLPDGMQLLVGDRPRFILGLEELIEAIARANTSLDFGDDVYEPLSDAVVLGSCHIRTPLPGRHRGHRDLGRYVFLLEVRDRLFFRSESFSSEDAAREAFGRGWGSSRSGPPRT